MSLKAKLQRMKNHLQIEEHNPPSVIQEKTNASPLIEKWAQFGFKPFTVDEETSFQKKQLYPFTGETDYLKEELEKIHHHWQETREDHPLSCRDVPLGRMMFFDTETTGLSTGAGNSIFLIGYARVLQEGIEVTQHILANPAEEVAFLYGFLLDFYEDDYLISYNGKAFDWPHVKSRHTFVRNEVPELPQFGHIDLLHAARRLWKHELPSCRLSIVEQEKLRLERKDDTPGSMAPLLYFDYLQDDDPRHLSGIIKHNDQDVRSLVYLYIEICNRLFLKKGPLPAKEHIQIGHWFEQLKWEALAEKHYQQALHSFDHARYEAYYKLGLLSKKQKKFAEAKSYLLQGITHTALPNPHIYIELSKLMEHVEKDYVQALEFAKEAGAILKKSTRLTGKDKALLKDIEKRLQRLGKKIG